jgi:glycosyltransferase involved in cell wall biosynthesis
MWRVARLWLTVARLSRAGWRPHLHVNGHNWSSWIQAGVCASASWKPFRSGPVLTVHSGLTPDWIGRSRWRRSAVRAVSVLFERIVAVNSEIHDALVSTGVTASRIEVCPAFLSLARPGQLPAGIRTWAADRHPLLSTALFFRPEYGFDLLVDALDGVRRRFPNVGCIVMGSEEGRAPAERLVAEMGLRDSVLFTGDLPHEQCIAVIAVSDLFVRPTRDDGDATSVREALAVGTRVVASRVGARPVGTILFEVDDRRALERSIIETLSEPPDHDVRLPAAEAGGGRVLERLYGLNHHRSGSEPSVKAAAADLAGRSKCHG